MDTGTQDATHKTPSEQVALVKEIGFGGVGPIYHNAAEIQQWLVELDQNRLKMLHSTCRCGSMMSRKPEVSQGGSSRITQRGDTLLWLYVTDKRGTPFGHQ